MKKILLLALLISCRQRYSGPREIENHLKGDAICTWANGDGSTYEVNCIFNKSRIVCIGFADRISCVPLISAASIEAR